MTDVVEHPALELAMAISEDCRESIWSVAIYVDGQLTLTEFYSLEPPEVPASNHLSLALWSIMKLSEGAQA